MLPVGRRSRREEPTSNGLDVATLERMGNSLGILGDDRSNEDPVPCRGPPTVLLPPG